MAALETKWRCMSSDNLDAIPIRSLVAAIEVSPLPTALFDAQDMLRFANSSYDSLFLHGLPTPVHFADVIRHGFRGGFGVKVDSGDIEAFLSSVLSRRRAVPRRAFATDLVDGTWVWVSEVVMEDGWMMSVMTDITLFKQEERRLRQARDSALSASMTDILTGLPNRRRILSELQAAMSGSLASKQSLSVAIVDVDHFKPINDRFGHLGGDEALRCFAEYLARTAVGIGTVGRIGGEEFLLIVPGSKAAKAKGQIDEVRAAVPPTVIDDHPPLPITFSAGVAEFDGGESVSSLMRRADLALYRAKAAGRNRVEVA